MLCHAYTYSVAAFKKLCVYAHKKMHHFPRKFRFGIFTFTAGRIHQLINKPSSVTIAACIQYSFLDHLYTGIRTVGNSEVWKMSIHRLTVTRRYFCIMVFTKLAWVKEVLHDADTSKTKDYYF